MSTVHGLQKPMNMTFKTAQVHAHAHAQIQHKSPTLDSTRLTNQRNQTKPTQTASLAGQFDVLSKVELQNHGVFAAILSKNFEFPVFGGWTLELNFNKPVLECV